MIKDARLNSKKMGLHNRKPVPGIRQNYLIVMDTESWVYGELEGMLRLGVAEIWGTPGKNIEDWVHCKTVRFKTIREFHEVLREYPNAVVIAHNTDHDFQVLGFHLYHPYLKNNESLFDLNGRSPFKFVVEVVKAGKVTFIDLMNWFSTSLKKVGNSVGCNKIDLHVSKMDGTSDGDLFSYCERDVEIVRRAYFSLWGLARDYGTSPGISIASMAMNIYLSAFLKKWWNKPIRGNRNHKEEHNKEMAAFFGGRTESYFKGKPTESYTVYKYDINSQYPSVMRDSLPYRRAGKDWSVRGGVPPVPDDKFYRLYKVVVNIKGDNPYRDLGGPGKRHIMNGEGRIIYGVGRYRAFLWQDEYRMFREMGFIEKAESAIKYHSAPILQEFVNHFYAKRLIYKKMANTAYEQLCKLVMNSLYGKFGQKEKGKWVSVKDKKLVKTLKTSSKYLGRMIIDLKKETYGVGYEGVFRYEESKGGVGWYSVMSIAGAITAKGRGLLLEAKKKIIDLGGYVFYCDTDSIICDRMLPNELVSQTDMGKFKLEEKFDSSELDVQCRKHYAAAGKLRAKGVSWVDENGNFHATTASKVKKCYKTQCAELPGKAVHIIKDIIKNLSLKNISRIEPVGSGRTAPHEFNWGELLPVKYNTLPQPL